MTDRATRIPSVVPLPAWKLAIAAFAGGVAGSLARAAAEDAFGAAGLPAWSSRIAVNVCGAFLIGALFARIAVRDSRGAPLGVPHAGRLREHLLGAGVLGGFTTVSGMAWDAASAAAASDWPTMAAVIGADALAGIAACAAGWRLLSTKDGARPR